MAPGEATGDDWAPGHYYLYAMWKQGPVIVNFLGNEPLLAIDLAVIDPVQVTSDTFDVVIPDDAVPTLTGFSFAGWCNYKSYTCMSGNLFQAGDTVTYTYPGEYNLFAIWIPKAFVITYRAATPQPAIDANYPVRFMPLPTVGLAGITPVSLRVPTLVGYEFLGWCLIPDAVPDAEFTGSCVDADGALGNIWQPGDSTESLVPGLYKFFAMWKPNPVIVNFVGNEPADAAGALAVINPVQIVSDDGTFAIVIPAGSNPTLAGFTFKGWCNYESPNCEFGNTFAAGDTVNYTYPGTYTLWAMWAPNPTIVESGGSLVSSSGMVALAGVLVISGLAAGSVLVRRRVAG